MQSIEIVLWQKALIGGSSRITARFRISGHNEKQLTAKTAKRFGDIKITLGMIMIEIESAVIFSSLERSKYHLQEIIEHKWYFLLLRKAYTKCVSNEIFNLHHLLLKRVHVSM